MRRYTQLTQEQRYQIYAYLKAGWTQTAIALELKVHKSTISRELKRNRGQRGYRAQQAQEKARSRQKERSGRMRIPQVVWELAEPLLCQEWSPQQISGWLARETSFRASPERIYQYVLADQRNGGLLFRHLRCQKQRRKRYGKHDRRGQLSNRRCISTRPEIVASRQRIGDWEADTIVGKGHQQAIVSLTERRSKLVLLRKVEKATSEAVSQAMIEMMKPLRLHHPVYTITSDNGREFAGHEIIARELEADFYFAHPYSSWERGLNENSNGLVRQYFPKGSDFTDITEDDIKHVMHRLNHRPRKTLDYRTPHQLFFTKDAVALTT
jgi:IS30 family transposase